MPQKSKKYITERIKIQNFVPGGQGIATLESGKKIFLWDALPDEIITKAELTVEKSSYCEGIALQRENASTHRIIPKDECFLSTSPWQVFDYAFELNAKQLLLAEIFRQQHVLLPEDFSIAKVVTDRQDYYYRNKMEYSLYFDHDDAKIHLAFHARGSHQKLPISRSSLEKPSIYTAAQNLINSLNAQNADARAYQSLILRTNSKGQVEGGLLKKHQPHPKFPHLTDSILGHEYSYSPNGFFQINLPVYELALLEIKRWIKTEDVLDLYAGVGTIGLSVARDRNLTLVESDQSAFREMEKNCSGTAAQPILAKSEDALDFIQHHQTVILDPPRAGCDVKLIQKLLEKQPQVIIYLSCNPITQARDLKLLESKYTPVRIVPYNFFPRTPHLEDLVVLEAN